MKIPSNSFKLRKLAYHKNLKHVLQMRIALLFVSFQLLVFFPALSNPRPWSDDWGYIYYASDPTRNIARDAIAAGRPILGFLDQFAYQNEIVTNNLIVLQIISMIGLLLLQLALRVKLKNSSFRNPMTTLAPLLLILIPGIQGYVYFLSCFPYPWACLLGFLSYDFLNSHTSLRKFIGCLFFVVAFLIYPAGAMFFFLSYLVELIKRFEEGISFGSNLRNLQKKLMNFFVCTAASLMIGNIIRIATDVQQSTRIELVNSLDGLVDKVVWVLTRLFVSEFRVFTVASPTPLRAAIEAALVFSLLTWFVLKPHRNLSLDRSLNFLLIILAPLLGAIPNIIILENQFEFRTLTPTFVMSLILWVYCFQKMLHRDSPNIKRRDVFSSPFSLNYRALVSILLISVATVNTQRDSKNLWVKPSLIRDNLTESALKRADVGRKDSICMVIPASVSKPLAKLGVYSMKSDLVSSWVPVPYMKLQLEQSELDPSRKVFVARIGTECDVSSIVINYRVLERMD